MTHPKPLTAILVSQTHWDRAWYQPFQVYRLRLVRLIDRLLDLLDQEPAFHSFTLDGQLLPLEDYLEIRPERRTDLERLIRAGRLLVGPWYVLADEYLVSPEALIRNLLLGLQVAQELGPVSRVGYVPDSFGHVSQLPQILQGFDIDSAFFWRGVGDEGPALGNEFWWDGPDGSRVLALHLRDGYHNAANLGYPMRWGDPSGMEFDMELALQRLRESIDLLKPHAQAGVVLLLNGIDHLDPDPAVPRIIARANETFEDVEIEHNTLPAYLTRVRAQLDHELPAFQGEFNRSRYAFALQGVYSSRMYLNQANERVQTLLECYAEPLSSWAWLLGRPYPAAFLRLAWRKLLQNHPHDDICGCSVDAVHQEDMVRFGEVEQLATTLARDSYRAIMAHIDRSAQPGGVPFVIFNPVAWAQSGTVLVELDFEEEDATAQDFHLVTAAGQPVPSQRLGQTNLIEPEVGKDNVVQRVRLAVSITDLPACGYRVYYARPGQPTEPLPVDQPLQLRPQGMENRYLRVDIQPDGTLALLDKKTGRQFQDLAYLVDDEDAGDEYDYSPCPRPEQFTTRGQPATIRLLEAGPLQVTYQISHPFQLPAGLSEDRQQRSAERLVCPVATTVTLRRDGRQLQLRTSVDNRARDHRLRLCFPSDIRTDFSAGDGHFDVLERAIDQPAGEHWEQPPSPTKHQRYFVDLSDGQVGLAIFNRGLAEYEILRDGGRNTIAVTLLRCVGYLSRDDLLTRSTHAGPGLPTPEAQCLGRHTFEYAIAPHAGPWQNIYRAAYGYRAPVVARRGTEHEGRLPTPSEKESWALLHLKQPDVSGALPAELSFIQVEPAVLLLSAVKQSERDERLILRFYNPTGEALTATLSLFQPIRTAELVNLNEMPQQPLPVDDQGRVELTVGAKQIQTVRVEVS